MFPIIPSYFGPGTVFSSALKRPLPVLTSRAGTGGSWLRRAGLGELPDRTLPGKVLTANSEEKETHRERGIWIQAQAIHETKELFLSVGWK